MPKQYNAKGIGLFLSGYCNLYDLALKNKTSFGTKEEILSKINELANLLDKLKTSNFSGACWGYNFPWQALSFIFIPKKIRQQLWRLLFVLKLYLRLMRSQK